MDDTIEAGVAPAIRSAERGEAGDRAGPPTTSGVPRARDVRLRASRVVALIDRTLSRQLDRILHDPAFQRMEALWRGIHWLVQASEDPMVKVRLLDLRWDELARDMERALDFDQSHLFSLVYNQEFGMPGGEPYGLIVVDHAITIRPGGESRTDDVAVMDKLADVAAAAFCPIAVGVHPSVLSLDRFDDIDLRQDLASSLRDPSFRGWKRLCSRPDSRFLAAVLPRLLSRRPHQGRDFPRLGFIYDEQVATTDDLLWMNGAFALAQVAMRAMARFRWPAAIRGTVPAGEGGTVDGPVRHFLPADAPGVVARFAIENAISETQEVVLNEAGFIALRQLQHTGMAAFLNVPSLHSPPTYDSETARMNAKMGAMLNYILCVSRFAHYVKVIARDWVGSYRDANQCQTLLNRWLRGYANDNDDPSPELRLQYPLRTASVKVFETPEKPGSYHCEIAVRPHYQLDQVTSEFHLTTVVGLEGGMAGR